MNGRDEASGTGSGACEGKDSCGVLAAESGTASGIACAREAVDIPGRISKSRVSKCMRQGRDQSDR